MGFLKDLLRGALGGHHTGRRQGRIGPHGSYDTSASGSAGSARACPRCKAANSPEARFCQQCGTPLSGATCGQCGMALSETAKFCPQCGEARA